MIPNLKFYVVSVVSIFLALAIGIYVGFTLDAQNVLIEQKEDIASKLEQKFDYLKNENTELSEEIKVLNKKNSQYIDFSKTVYPEVIKDRLAGIKVAIIETSDDYVYSSLDQSLQMAGASVSNITTIKNKFLNEQLLKETYFKINGKQVSENKLKDEAIIALLDSIVKGNNSQNIDILHEYGLINTVGNYKQPVDYVIIAGGSKSKKTNEINDIDKRVINYAKKLNIPIIGIEKENVNFSYMEEYKNSRISTIDNIDTIMGKVALIMSMEGRSGNYGVKTNAERLLPDLSNVKLQ